MLTPRQERFVTEYLIDLNATKAAKRAGYSENSAHVTGTKLLNIAAVRDAVERLKNARSERTGIDADWVLREAAELTEKAKAGNEPNFAAWAKGIELVGKHVSVMAFRERVEHSGVDGGPIETVNLDKLAGLSDAALEEIARAEARAVH